MKILRRGRNITKERRRWNGRREVEYIARQEKNLVKNNKVSKILRKKEKLN